MLFGCVGLFLFLQLASAQLNCLYYRVRADVPLTVENTRRRPCSSQIPFCVKIIHKMESEETSHADSYIEGRCAFSQEECKNQNSCFPEEPREQGGSTVREYKCCSNEDFSNGGKIVITHFVFLLALVVQHSFLFG